MQMRVGLLQLADCGPRKEDLLAKGEASCRLAAAMGADIALFPELWYVSDHHFVERSWRHDYELWRGKHLWGQAEWQPGQEFAEQIGRWHAQAIGRDDPYLLHFQRVAQELHQSSANHHRPKDDCRSGKMKATARESHFMQRRGLVAPRSRWA